VRAWRKEEGEKEEMREGFAEEREGDARGGGGEEWGGKELTRLALGKHAGKKGEEGGAGGGGMCGSPTGRTEDGAVPKAL
jgi:hypothetical protein